jgi:hypothetical protein
MSRRGGLFLMAVLLVVLAGCGAERPTPAPIGNFSGFHVVDGYWLGPETTCADPAAPVACPTAIATATPIVTAQHADAGILRATVAEPNCSGTTLSPCTGAGLYKGLYVVFDLSDGSRRIVSLICEDSGPTSQGPDCRLYPLTNQG